MKKFKRNTDTHLLDYVNSSSLGKPSKSLFPINSLFHGIRAFSIETPFFDRIISSLCWHPFNREILILGSREGSIKLVKLGELRNNIANRVSHEHGHIGSNELYEWLGHGRGHTITEIKWDRNNVEWFYTASIDGKITKKSCDGSKDICLKDLSGSVEVVNLPLLNGELVTQTERRFASLDVNCDKKMLMAGDNCGYIHFLSTGRDNVTKIANVSQSVHAGHILHCEFNPVQPHIIVTSSVDRLVKIWDLRMISRNPKPVFKHEFKFPLNAATFNPSNGATLVVADNREQIAIFRGPTWEKELVVRHAHHQYQMNSLLKPTFHPSLDLFLIGSSGTNVPPVVDIFDIESVTPKFQLSDSKPGVLSMNVFNSTGDMIASTRRAFLLIWKKDYSLYT